MPLNPVINWDLYTNVLSYIGLLPLSFI